MPLFNSYLKNNRLEELTLEGISDTHILWSNSGVLSGDSNFVFNDSTGTVTLIQAAANNALFIDANADCGNSTSTGGALRIDNTGNVGTGILVYTNIGATADGRLMVLRADNTAYDQAVLRIENDGTNSAISVNQTTTSGTQSAISITSLDTGNSVLGVSGKPTAKGVGKFTHNATSSGNSSGAAISASVDNTSNDAQGFFLDYHGTTKALNIDVDSNTASNVTGLIINVANAGDGDAIALDAQTGNANFEGYVIATNSGIRTKIVTDDTTNPPFDEELDTAFGTPATVGSGFVGILDDNDGGTNCYLCWTTGTDAEWFYCTGTKAVERIGSSMGLLLTLTYGA
jgi:hypothetical protein